MQIFVNGRFVSHKITGVQRYAHEITSRIKYRSVLCQPVRRLQGWQGHLWEQSILPLRSCRGVLWSPCAAGPLVTRRHVVTFHDLFPIDHPEWYSRAYSTWYNVLMRRLAATASSLIAVSNYTKERLVEKFNVSSSKITVIHNGVSSKFFRARRNEPTSSREFSPLPSQKYLLCVGSLEPRKNLLGLMRAWSKIVSDLPSDLWLLVAGSRDERVYGKAFSEPLPPRVFFLGYVADDQLTHLYSNSVGFVYPSLGEGFGLPPLEAMACGVPVLTSSNTSLPEVCGSAAIYVDPADLEDLAVKIKLLATDKSLRDRLSSLGLARAQQFSWDRSAQSTLQILETVACSRGNE